MPTRRRWCCITDLNNNNTYTMKNVRQLLLIPLLAASAFAPARTVVTDAEASGHSGTARVMSYNVRIEVSGDTADMSWKSRRPGVVRMIHLQAPDIVGIQEPTVAQKEYIFENLPEYGHYCISVNDTLPESRTGNTALLYRLDKYEPVDSGYFWLSATPWTPSLPWDASDPYYRVGIWLRLFDKATGRDVYALTTHFPYMSSAKDDEVRARCSRLIVDKLASIAGDDAAVFVTGDMNTAPVAGEPDAPGSRSLAPFYTWMQSAREQAVVSDDIASFNGFGTVPPGAQTGAIDHIYYRNARPLVFETLTAADTGLRWNSDHYPVVCTFTY